MNFIHNDALVSSEELSFSYSNRAFQYGDGLFETMMYSNGEILFFEDHYFRLMGSMRFLRFEIPMSWTPEFLEEKCKELIQANLWANTHVRLKLMVYRSSGGRYTPESNKPEYVISGEPSSIAPYPVYNSGLVLDTFQYHHKPSGRLSNLKTIGSAIYTLAGIFAQENDLDEAILINEKGNLVEASSSNLFLIQGNKLITPPLESGCLKGVFRKNLLDRAKDIGLEPIEKDIKPFDLIKSDDVLLTNMAKGIQWVSGYKKKSFTGEKAREITEAFYELINSKEGQTEH